MSEQEREARAGDAARDEAVRVLAGTLVDLAVLVGVSLAIEHRTAIGNRVARLLARARRTRPPVDELAIAEHAARVAAYSHGEGT